MVTSRAEFESNAASDHPLATATPTQSQTDSISIHSGIFVKSELNWSQLIHAEIIAVTSAMRKNARWSSMNVNSLNMGGLGMSMGLRRGQTNAKDVHLRNQSNPLMQGFQDLKEYLRAIQDINELDALILLKPFLEVIHSGKTTGPIAGTALGSIEKFLQYGVVGLHSPNVANAMNSLSSAATHCKFEASDSASDELVLLRMLQVLQMALSSECGQVLSDEAVCEMMETGLSMCCQMRLSEMLRRSAEHAMINMVIAMFERLKTLEDEWPYVESPTEATVDEPQLSGVRRYQHKVLHMSAPRRTPTPTSRPQTPMPLLDHNAETFSKPTTSVEKTENESNSAEKSSDTTGNSVDDTVEPENPEQSPTTDSVQLMSHQQPYGLPAIQELLRVLVSLLNPHEHKHTDSMRLMSLSILNIAFEVGGKSISRFESLRNLVADDFCKHLLQLAKSESTPLLALTLRVISTVLDTMRPYLKLQQELFLFFLIERLSHYGTASHRNIKVDTDEEGITAFVPSTIEPIEKRSAPLVDVRSASSGIYGRSGKGYSADHAVRSAEVRELLLECLVQCTRQPTMMVDIWYNYDSDLSCGDLFDEIIQFISKNAFADPREFTSSLSHATCLDLLFMFVDHMVQRIDDQDSEQDYHETQESLISPKDLMQRKSRKKLILKGVSLFNEKPKNGIRFLIENGIIMPDEKNETTSSLVHFLKSTQQLNKRILGEFLGKPDNLPLLQVYMRQFDFKGKRMDEALRLVLETFRLPGESQQIMRVTETFAEVYFEAFRHQIANPDAAQVLAYSIILLNTDQHNPQIKRRMLLDDYLNNLRGVNGDKNFDKDYLRAIYEAIKQDEIIMPEEHQGRLGFNYAWKQLLQRSASAGLFVTCNTGAYDKGIFELSWKQVLAAFLYAFDTTQDDTTLQKTISGFYKCAMLAGHFELYDVFDAIVVNLSSLTGLLELDSSYSTQLDPIVEVAGHKYVVSNLAVRFGRNYKGQLAAVVLFTVVARHGNSMRKSWKKIMDIIRNLFVNSLLPGSMLQVQDFVSGTTSIPLKPKSPQPAKQQTRRDGSLLSALSSYLLSPYSNDDAYRADPTEEEIESTMCAVDCMTACHLEELFADFTQLDIEPLKALMTAIRTVGYDEKTINESTTQVAYDPVTVLFLEFMITAGIQNSDRIEQLWDQVIDYIFGILEHADNQSVLVVERTVVALLRLCICFAHQDNMQERILHCLKLLLDFSPTVTQAVAEQMMAGIFNLSSAHSENLNNTEFVNTILEIKQKVASAL